MDDPEKLEPPVQRRVPGEIRFTRSKQAGMFFGAALLFFWVSVALLLLALPGWTRTAPPVLNTSGYAILPLPLAALLAWAGVHLARHAYIVFSTVGVELYPFWFPSRNMQVLFWPEIEKLELEAGGNTLVVRLPEERAVFVSLAPLSRPARTLLAHAVAGLQNRGSGAGLSQADPPPVP
ncbi:MAG TPA: hypothetical protein VMN36_07295 [Verrucomicrobiales bacterium]|nr:hypothetical protein [Verrucomicrobiales bacterium]